MAQQRGIIDNSLSPNVKLRSINIEDCQWTEGFWADRFDQAHKITQPFMWNYFNGKSRQNGLAPQHGRDQSWGNFLIAAGEMEGNFKGRDWQDGDFYKWLEATAFIYANTKDKVLKDQMDNVIPIIGKAQQKDGYISNPISIQGRDRWENYNHHELYNMGHLINAACIHHRVTGELSLLEIAKKAADYLYTVFMQPNEHLSHFGFNPTQIMGLVELYRTTGEQKYLELASQFVKMRGSVPGGTDNNQDRVPLRDEYLAVGHAVCGTYLYCGATDLFAETGDSTLIAALDRIWEDLHHNKLYITGGVSGKHHTLSPRRHVVTECFGDHMSMPNATCSNESCSHTGNAMWNWRLFGLTGEARYMEIIERTLYNAFLAGMGIEGNMWMYTNPLRRYGSEGIFEDDDTMQRWIYRDGYCCPPQLLRTIAKLSGWAYSTSDHGVWVNLYGSNVLETNLSDENLVRLVQKTNYPWSGDVQITIENAPKQLQEINLRIPHWANGTSINVNGESVEGEVLPSSYFKVSRRWKKGDVIQINMPMKPQLIEANPEIEELVNQVAVIRGPIVYCLESPDLGGGVKPADVLIPSDMDLNPVHDPHLLGGVTMLEGKAWYKAANRWKNQLYQPLGEEAIKPIDIRLIPYYAWANRGISYMTVWMNVLWK